MTSMTGTNFDMRNQWKVDTRIRKILEGSFFYALIDMVPYVQKTSLQSFIQSCYDKDSSTFTFGHNRKFKLYFGLEDVFALSGFPVGGRQPIICDDIDTKTLCQKLLGNYDEECRMKMKVSKNWLKRTFEVVPPDVEERDISSYARAYLIYLIGTKVLPNCDKATYYPVYWLQFIEDLSPTKLNDVAWGAAAHAMLHSGLRSGSRKNVKGPTWILELFFMERFPKIANLYLNLGMNTNHTIGASGLKVKAVPLFDYWCPLMVQPGKVTGKPNPEEFVSIRDQMTSKDVNWLPYLHYPGYFRQKIFFSRVVLFNFDQIIYHEPEKGFHQLDIVNLQPVERLEALIEKSSKGTKERKLMLHYRPYIQMWENRHLDSNCIKDTCPAFSLPSVPDNIQNDDPPHEMASSDFPRGRNDVANSSDSPDKRSPIPEKECSPILEGGDVPDNIQIDDPPPMIEMANSDFPSGRNDVANSSDSPDKRSPIPEKECSPILEGGDVPDNIQNDDPPPMIEMANSDFPSGRNDVANSSDSPDKRSPIPEKECSPIPPKKKKKKIDSCLEGGDVPINLLDRRSLRVRPGLNVNIGGSRQLSTPDGGVQNYYRLRYRKGGPDVTKQPALSKAISFSENQDIVVTETELLVALENKQVLAEFEESFVFDTSQKSSDPNEKRHKDEKVVQVNRNVRPKRERKREATRGQNVRPKRKYVSVLREKYKTTMDLLQKYREMIEDVFPDTDSDTESVKLKKKSHPQTFSEMNSDSSGLLKFLQRIQFSSCSYLVVIYELVDRD